MLEVRRLRLLRELKLRGTLADVALALHQSPSSVSQQLSLLEKEVGVALLRKAGRRVQLTPQAEILVEHASLVLDQLERAESEVNASLEVVTGHIRLAIFQSAAFALLPSTLTTLSEAHPLLRVSMSQQEPGAALSEARARDFDLVVAEQYPHHAAPWLVELDRADLLTDAIRLAVPPGGPLGRIGTISQARDAPWVMEPDGVASRHWAEQACRQAGFEPDVRFETADLQAHIRLVESGAAVALLPDLLWEGRRPTVALRDLNGDPRRTVFTATRHTAARSPAVVAVRRALVSAADFASP
ncbi:LysR substrate-binding domain-containing protein [Aeromicrobium sp. CF4.19]|uniref:LysR substrate-binding domain-containing protein n=1 Tax=Aeromicrobium sp. CF4.19 TaxID=3373082 RepID=UPI003EE68436